MSVQIDQKAPNLKVSEWVQGMDTNLDKQNDNVVVVEVFQVNCPGCFMYGIPESIEIYNKYKSEGVSVLMAADILLFDSQIVPVGKDQKQHLEMTRDIAIRFNNTFGDTLVVPEPDIEEVTQLVPGIDGQKMSKSYNNTIPIFHSHKQIRKKILRIVTDATDIDKPKDKDTPLFQLYSLFLDSSRQKDLSDRYEGTGLRYGDVKQELFEKVMDYFQPYREQRKTLISRPGQVHDILKSGAKKAKDVAEEVLDRVQAAVGVRYL